MALTDINSVVTKDYFSKEVRIKPRLTLFHSVCILKACLYRVVWCLTGT